MGNDIMTVLQIAYYLQVCLEDNLQTNLQKRVSSLKSLKYLKIK